jgi:hypothetical protein
MMVLFGCGSLFSATYVSLDLWYFFTFLQNNF